MSNNEFLLGIDIGTGGCKATIIDKNGSFVANGYTEYPTYHPYPGWSNQKPEDWFPAFLKSFNMALEKGNVSASQIICLSVDASAHNAVLLDKDDNVLCDTIMWTDQRSNTEAKYLLNNYGDEIFKATFQKPSPTWTLPQLMWIKENDSKVFKNLKRIMFIKDYIRFQLTGEWYTDHIEAQGSMLFDNLSWTWSKDICKIGGIPLDALPPVIKPTDTAGHITKDAAKITGLKEGIPVICGASDTATENYAVGAIEEGHCVIKMATAGTVNIFTQKGMPNPKALTYSHVVKGLWYTCFATNSAAQSLRWYRDTFCKEELEKERKGGESVYRKLDYEAIKVPPGSDGVIFHPYLMGERSPYWDPKLRGSFTGITANHDMGHFNRAIMEGVAYSIKDNFILAEKISKEIKEVSFVGGGAKSPLWRSILANVLNKPVLKFENDDSSFGTALLAGVGIGVFTDHKDAISKGVNLIERVLPDPDVINIYEEGFKLYGKIRNNLVGIYHEY